jgi:hypothetical protein
MGLGKSLQVLSLIACHKRDEQKMVVESESADEASAEIESIEGEKLGLLDIYC